jgi:hypothetical protein
MKIVWEKFDFEYDSLNKQWNEVEDDPGFEEEFNQAEAFLDGLQSNLNIRTGVVTPFGVFDVVDPFSPFNKFDMWIGHTDFNVDKVFLSSLSKMQGIEVVKALSRYSFLIGCGKLFDFKEVRIAIELMIGMHSESKLSDVQSLINSFGDKKYAVYLYPNGEFNYTTNEDRDFHSNVRKFEKEKENSSGVLLRNV